MATGGTTAFGPYRDIYGIRVQGDDPRVLNNDVSDTVKVGIGQAVGILFAGNGGLAVNNRITVADTGIFFAGSGK